ncbi:MAG: MnhB domain-containing protein [Microthrixaceae bacterium]
MTQRRSVILDLCVQAEFHTLLLLSLYLLLSGHNQPGGGFAGGLVASCAFGLRFVAGGQEALSRSVPIPATTFLGVGMLFALVTGSISLAAGHEFMESSIIAADLVVLGSVKTSSVLFFDMGVYLVVLGMSLLLLEQLGAADGKDSDEGQP